MQLDIETIAGPAPKHYNEIVRLRGGVNSFYGTCRIPECPLFFLIRRRSLEPTMRGVAMYGLPKDFDGSMFVGRTVGLVSFSVNTMHVSFDNHLSITITSSFEHRIGTEEPNQDCVQRVPVEESRLMQLAGHTVERVEANTDGTLTLHFNGGQVLRCFDDSPNYECYSITHGKEEIFV